MRGEIIKIPRNSTLYIFPFLLLLPIFRHFNDHPQSGKGLRTCCEIINLLYTFFTCVQSEFEKKEGRKEKCTGDLWAIQRALYPRPRRGILSRLFPRHFLRNTARDTLRKILVNKTLVIPFGRRRTSVGSTEYRLIFFLNCFRSLVAIVSRVGGTFKAAREGENVPYVLERAYTGRGHMDRTQTRTIFSPVGKGKSLATRGFVRNTEEERVSSTPVASPLRRSVETCRFFHDDFRTIWRHELSSIPYLFFLDMELRFGTKLAGQSLFLRSSLPSKP